MVNLLRMRGSLLELAEEVDVARRTRRLDRLHVSVNVGKLLIIDVLGRVARHVLPRMAYLLCERFVRPLGRRNARTRSALATLAHRAVARVAHLRHVELVPGL